MIIWYLNSGLSLLTFLRLDLIEIYYNNFGGQAGFNVQIILDLIDVIFLSGTQAYSERENPSS